MLGRTKKHINPWQASGLPQFSVCLLTSPSGHRHLSLCISIMNPQKDQLRMTRAHSIPQWETESAAETGEWHATLNISHHPVRGPQTKREAALESWMSGCLGKCLLACPHPERLSSRKLNPAPGKCGLWPACVCQHTQYPSVSFSFLLWVLPCQKELKL